MAFNWKSTCMQIRKTRKLKLNIALNHTPVHHNQVLVTKNGTLIYVLINLLFGR